MKKTFALAYASRPNEVALWCDFNGKLPDGTIIFYAKNGAWDGHFTPDNKIIVLPSKHVIPGIKVWEGEIGYSDADYNEAMAYIEQQIKGGRNGP